MPHGSPRCAVCDLGSNSVRLVVFEGAARNPTPIFNEKAVLRLGRGVASSGRMEEESLAQAMTVMGRYHAIVRAMGAAPFDVLATSAVRDAANGPAFVAELERRLPGIRVQVLSGADEAELSAAGVLCGIPAADGVLADIGGGSLELVRLDAGVPGPSASLPMGVIRLAEKANDDPVRARALVEEALPAVPWLKDGLGRDLYLVGGAFRALARIHMAQTAYPLQMIHHYTLEREEGRDLAGVIAGASRRAIERIPGVPLRRIGDLPFAAVVMRRLLRATGARRVVFSANGLREGWFMRRLPAEVRGQDPMLAAGREMAGRLGRDHRLPQALVQWTDPLWSGAEAPEHARLRTAACWLSDIGSHEHPDYRAEQAFLRVLRQPGIGLDHHARAWLALCLAVRYDAGLESPFLATSRALLDVTSARRAETLGLALRLAYTLSAATPDLLAGTALRLEGARLVLTLAEGTGVFAGDSVMRRLDRLASALGLEPVIEVARAHADARAA
jgi:exopolyphosphatase/guanosine-5'-triphosphate,3'-diphosphate pyrophosphatase